MEATFLALILDSTKEGKIFLVKVLQQNLKGQSPMAPHVEYLWEDCKDEREVVKRDHSRLTLPKISSLKLKFKLEGIIEDGFDFLEARWEEASE